MSVVSPRSGTKGKVVSRLTSPRHKHVKPRQVKKSKLIDNEGTDMNRSRRKSAVESLRLRLVEKEGSEMSESRDKVSDSDHITIVTFNVGNIWSDYDWNRNRWKEILQEIVSKDADVVILHEVMKESGEIFASLNDHGYKGCVPYIKRAHVGHKRDNWEVIFSKFKMNDPYYETLSSNDGLSCVNCVIEGSNNREINICATTWSTLTRRDVERLSASTSHFLDAHVNNIVSVSANKLGSLIIPPKGFCDVWTKLGSKVELEETLNKSMCADYSVCNRRGDHIWVSGASSKDMSIIVVENGSEHNGLFARLRLRTRDQPYRKSSNNTPRTPRHALRATSMIISSNGKLRTDPIDMSSVVDGKYRRNSISVESPRHSAVDINSPRDTSMHSSSDKSHSHKEKKLSLSSPCRDVGTIMRHRSLKNISDINQCQTM